MMGPKNHLNIDDERVFNALNSIYNQGWDDCLDVVLSMFDEKNASLDKDKVVGLQVLVKNKKFEQFRSDLKVIDGLF
jgi:hypothetical protein